MTALVHVSLQRKARLECLRLVSFKLYLLAWCLLGGQS